MPRSLQTAPSERPLKIHNFRFPDMFDMVRCIFTCCLEWQNWDPHVDQFQTWRTPNFLFHIRIPHLNFDSAESISSEKCSTNDIKRDWKLYQAECHWSACIWQIKCRKKLFRDLKSPSIRLNRTKICPIWSYLTAPCNDTFKRQTKVMTKTFYIMIC